MRVEKFIAPILLCLFVALFAGCGGGGGGTTPTLTTISGTTSKGFLISSGQGDTGDTINIPVVITTGSETRAATCTLTFDPLLIGQGEAGTGSIKDNLASLGSGIASRRKWGSGSLDIFFACENPSSSTVVMLIPFKLLSEGTAFITVESVQAYDGDMQPIP